MVSDYALLVPTTVIMNLLDIPQDQFARMQTMVQHITGYYNQVRTSKAGSPRQMRSSRNATTT